MFIFSKHRLNVSSFPCLVVSDVGFLSLLPMVLVELIVAYWIKCESKADIALLQSALIKNCMGVWGLVWKILEQRQLQTRTCQNPFRRRKSVVVVDYLIEPELLRQGLLWRVCSAGSIESAQWILKHYQDTDFNLEEELQHPLRKELFHGLVRKGTGFVGTIVFCLGFLTLKTEDEQGYVFRYCIRTHNETLFTFFLQTKGLFSLFVSYIASQTPSSWKPNEWAFLNRHSSLKYLLS